MSLCNKSVSAGLLHYAITIPLWWQQLVSSDGSWRVAGDQLMIGTFPVFNLYSIQ